MYTKILKYFPYSWQTKRRLADFVGEEDLKIFH